MYKYLLHSVPIKYTFKKNLPFTFHDEFQEECRPKHKLENHPIIHFIFLKFINNLIAFYNNHKLNFTVKYNLFSRN